MRERKRDKREKRRRENPVFYNIISEMTCHHFFLILLFIQTNLGTL